MRDRIVVLDHGRIIAIGVESRPALEMIERHAEVFDARLFGLAAAVHLKGDRKGEKHREMAHAAILTA